ncbi:MAG: HAD family phosphatase [Pirellulales bacterium]|nr:HAD family phosphatase [Pirellulales bacterium]
MNGHFGIIFDVDGVIADSEAVNVRATSQAFADILGIRRVAAEDFQKGLGRGAAEYVRAGAASHRMKLSPDQVQSLVMARQENFLEILREETLPAYPGVLKLIFSALASQEFSLAIATSSTRGKSLSVLASAQIPVEEMVYVCGDDVARKKPDPEVFQIACRRLSLAPKFCVVIEDSPYGIEAASRAGCVSMAVTNTCTRRELRRADQTVDSLCEVSLATLRTLLNTQSSQGGGLDRT